MITKISHMVPKHLGNLCFIQGFQQYMDILPFSMTISH